MMKLRNVLKKLLMIRTAAYKHMNISRHRTLVLILIVFVLYTWNVYTFVYYDSSHQVSQYLKYINVFHKYSTKREDLKYVLQWTTSNAVPFVFMGRGQEGFIKRNCPVQNCFMTDDRLYFRDVKDFDVILFNSPEIHRSYWTFPSQRSPYQIYTFVSTESSDNYPICLPSFNDFFNRTWTYKLESDIPFNYIIITNNRYEKIGPKKEMHWMDVNKMSPVDDYIKARLAKKTKAAAWFVSNCYAINDRDIIARRLKNELKRYGLQLDIYGKCGDMTCGSEQKECFAMIERDYYFYLAFENSFSMDYATEKLLTALQHFSIPIVYGAANYSRFMPQGIYLDAKSLGVQELAKHMRDIINDKSRYYDFFKWHNHYSYLSQQDALDFAICNFCAMINDNNFVGQKKIYSEFLSWWVEPGQCKS